MAQAINSGQDIEIKNITLNDTTDTAIPFTRKPNNVLIRNRADTGVIYIRVSDGATDYFTVPEGAAITLDFSARTLDPLYLRAETGTPVAEVFIIYD